MTTPKIHIIDTGGVRDRDRLLKKYVKTVENTRKFNLGLTYAKATLAGNDITTKFYRKDNDELLTEWYIKQKAKVLEFGCITYKENR